MQDFDVISDYLVSKIDIHVSGACGPDRVQPIDCLYPVHHAYSTAFSKKHVPIDQCMAAAVPGGVPRPVKSSVARDGFGLVYDRDIITTWRLPDIMSAYQVFFWEKEFERALARNTMLVVLEAFHDSHPDISFRSGTSVLQAFRSFVEGLGTQLVSITTSSIVFDMAESYQRMKEDLAPLSSEPSPWEVPDLLRALHEFVLTRECWHYAQDQGPALEVAFGVTSGRRSLSRRRISEEMILQFDYSYNLPTVGFHDLQNVVLESTDFILKPSLRLSRPYSELQQLEIEHYIGPALDWLR